MAQNETWLNHDLLNAVKVQYLDGNLFSMDNAGNLIGVKLTRDGVDYSGGGSVSASVIRSDGGTVAVIGALSGNTATVVLPQAAYAVPGVVSIVVKLTVSGEVTTIAAVVANVYQSSTDSVVDPGTIIPSVENLISAIETAVASIPADYSSLWTSLAPAFSTSVNYTAGQYVTYNGALYRFTTDHAAGAWNSAHVTATNIGSDLSSLKSAIQQDVVSKNNIVPFPYKDPAVLSLGVQFTPDHRSIHIVGTPTGGATFQIFGTWGANNNIQNTQFVPGKKYFILNKDPLFKIVFFNSSGTALRFISASVNSFTVPVGSTGANIYYQFTGAGSYVNYYFLPFIVDESTYRKQIESEYDCAVPVRTEYDGWHIEETYFSGRKKITDIDYDTIVERFYESDGTTLKATRTTSIIGEVLSTELVPAT